VRPDWFHGTPPPLPVVALRTITGTTIAGRLRSYDGLVVVLAGAIQLGEPERPGGPTVATPMDGDTVVPWANVDWWQQGLDPTILMPSGTGPERPG